MPADKSLKKLFLVLSLLGLSLGCTALPPVKNPHINESNLPSECLIEGIHPIKQGYQGCVPACIEMVFRFYGKELDKDAVADWIQRARGTTPEALEQFLGWQGFNVHTFSDWRARKSRIKYFLSQGYPVIAGGKLGLQDIGHMIVLIGYDDSKVIARKEGQFKGAFFALDPSPGKMVQIGYDLFAEFHRGQVGRTQYYGLVVYPKTTP
jgi:hypothetical protein